MGSSTFPISSSASFWISKVIDYLPALFANTTIYGILHGKYQRAKIAACGVCNTDLHVIKGEVKFPMPCVLGHEISGVVAEVAPDVKTTRPGDAVVCSFIMPCGVCDYCVRGRDDLCETFFAMNRLKGPLYAVKGGLL